MRVMNAQADVVKKSYLKLKVAKNKAGSTSVIQGVSDALLASYNSCSEQKVAVEGSSYLW